MNVATIDNNGRAIGKAVGMTNIIASAGGKMGMAVLRVTAEKVLTAIQITPAAPRVPVRRAVALTATGIYSDGTNANLTAMVDWTSSVPANATVTNTGAKGLVVGVKAGTSRISAKLGEVTGGTDVTVTEPKLTAVTVDPPTRHHRAHVHPGVQGHRDLRRRHHAGRHQRRDVDVVHDGRRDNRRTRHAVWPPASPPA